MKASLSTIILLLIWSGCERSLAPDSETRPHATRAVPVVLIAGLEEGVSVISKERAVMLGSYHDLRPYDSLHISLRVRRINPRPAPDRVVMKIGPTFYLRDSVSDIEKDVRFTAKTSLIAKRSFCGFTCMVMDSGARLQLSRVQVIGWTTE